MKIKIKKLNSLAKVPSKSFVTDFCYDCVATSVEEILPGVYSYGLGFSVEINEPIKDRIYSIEIRPRSSICKTGLVLANSVGTVDYNYRGEIKAVFYDIVPQLPKYKIGDNICQLLISETVPVEWEESSELSTTDRNTGGFGSTGN